MFPKEVLVNKHAQIFDIVFALQRNVKWKESVKEVVTVQQQKYSHTKVMQQPPVLCSVKRGSSLGFV